MIILITEEWLSKLDFEKDFEPLIKIGENLTISKRTPVFKTRNRGIKRAMKEKEKSRKDKEESKEKTK